MIMELFNFEFPMIHARKDNRFDGIRMTNATNAQKPSNLSVGFSRYAMKRIQYECV
jgi:hypothetical protein